MGLSAPICGLLEGVLSPDLPRPSPAVPWRSPLGGEHWGIFGERALLLVFPFRGARGGASDSHPERERRGGMTPWCIKVLEVIRSKKNVLLSVEQLLEGVRVGVSVTLGMTLGSQK
jgi:hypothetical protein